MNIFKKKDKTLKSIFITAGYPELNSLDGILNDLQDNNIDFAEVGMPFSDPLADGPVIQATSNVALKNGMHLTVLFEQLEKRTSKLPITLMGYINPVLQFGLENFLQKAKDVNVQGLILPDIEVDLYESRYKETFDKYGIPVCFLVTPSTSEERVKKSAKLAENGFIYLVSSNSTTGNNVKQQDLSVEYAKIKSWCGETPVVIGFGIRDKESFEEKTQGLDGGIIGTAFLNAVESGGHVNFLKALN